MDPPLPLGAGTCCCPCRGLLHAGPTSRRQFFLPVMGNQGSLETGMKVLC